MTPETLLDLFVLAPVGLLEIDGNGRVEVANLAARRLLAPFLGGRTLENLFDALQATAPDLAARVRGFEGGRGVAVEGLELDPAAVVGGSGAPGVHLSVVNTGADRFVAVVTDAGDLARARSVIARLEGQLRAVDSAVRDHAIFTLGTTGTIETWSESAERLHQYTGAEAIGQPFAMLVPEASGDGASRETAPRAGTPRDTLAIAARNGWVEEEGLRARRDGSTFWGSTITAALRGANGMPLGYSVVTRDLSEQKRLEEATREDAGSVTDYLTGVSTRRAFFDVAGSEVARGRRYSQPLSILLVEPDHFRELHEEHKEAFTDEWLRVIASICRQESRNTDIVGRVGGEEFAVLLPSTELSGGLVLAERIRERMQRHVFQGEHTGVRCTVSVGVAELTDNVTSVDGLLGAAEQAVEHARQAGRNLVVGYDA